jgi:hypothetical protein
MGLPHSSRRRSALAATVALVVAGGSGLLAGPGTSAASSHREAPLVANDPQADATDLYAFVSPDDPSMVTLVANWIPFEAPSGGPNFFPFAENTRYDIRIDSDGDARPDLTYRWTFRNSYQNKNTFLYNTGQVTSLTDPDLNFRQTYDLDAVYPDGTSARLVHAAPVAPSRVGDASMPDYAALRAQAVTPVGGGGRTFAGQSDDPFFLDLRIFDLLYGADLTEAGHDTLSGYNVNTVVLQVPKTALAYGHDATRNPVVGIWTTTERRSTRVLKTDGSVVEGGTWVQVSRLGNPLVNEAVVPVGAKDRFNGSQPANDAQFGAKVLDPEVPRLIQAIYGIPAPAAPRNDLVAVFLTGVPSLNAFSLNADAGHADVASEQLRLNMSVAPSAVPNRMGVLAGDAAGFPNGRRLGDDVIDIAIQALEGVLLPGHPAAVDGLGDGVNGNDVTLSATFPYVALPHSGSAT